MKPTHQLLLGALSTTEYIFSFYRMGNGKRSGEALQRRAEKKAVKVEHKNKLARLSEPNWICKAILVYGQECGNDNFARRANCNICQAPNPKPASRVLKTKAAKPVKQTNWRKNPSPADIQENIRLRSLLEEEKASVRLTHTPLSSLSHSFATPYSLFCAVLLSHR